MKTSNTKTLKNFAPVNGAFDTCPMVISFEKKELTDKDCYYLRYCLMRFIKNNQDNIYEHSCDSNTLYYNIDKESSICDNSLYIGNFEGYQIDDNIYLHDLELDISDRVILNVLDKELDQFTSYLID